MSLNLIQHKRYIHAMQLPEQVKIVEVGPRDGLQNQAASLSIADRVTLINRLSGCGFPAIETGSLVSPRLVPQMADSEAVFQQIQRCPNTAYVMLTPNQRALERALASQVEHIAVFCAATDAFSLKNIHRTVQQSLADIAAICRQAEAADIHVRGYISCVLGCPYQGEVKPNRVAAIAAQLQDYGCAEISLGDTIGIGTPGMVVELIQTIAKSLPITKMAVHFHDTYGQALANILVALQAGIHIIDSSVGGLGGCPFAPGAAGNVASEDVVYMLNGLGIRSGINLKKLLVVSRKIADLLQRPPSSRVAMAPYKIHNKEQ